MPIPDKGRVPYLKKRRQVNETIILPHTAQKLVASLRDDFSILIDDNNDSESAFRRSSGSPQRRDLFTKELNRILCVVGKKSKRRLTTHLFRIGIITSLIERYGIDAAQHLAGHRNVAFRLQPKAYNIRRNHPYARRCIKPRNA